MIFDYSLAGLASLARCLPDPRVVGLSASERGMITLVEVVLAFVVTSALLIALIHLLLPAKRS